MDLEVVGQAGEYLAAVGTGVRDARTVEVFHDALEVVREVVEQAAIPAALADLGAILVDGLDERIRCEVAVADVVAEGVVRIAAHVLAAIILELGCPSLVVAILIAMGIGTIEIHLPPEALVDSQGVDAQRVSIIGRRSVVVVADGSIQMIRETVPECSTLYNFVRNRNIWYFSTLSVHNICRYYNSCPYRFPAFVTHLLLCSMFVTLRQIKENAPRIADVGLSVGHLHTYPNIFVNYEQIYLPVSSECSSHSRRWVGWGSGELIVRAFFSDCPASVSPMSGTRSSSGFHLTEARSSPTDFFSGT